MSEETGAEQGGERAGGEAGPQTLAQMQAGGAEVVGSDDRRVSDLKEVSDADILIGRTLKRDLRISVNRVREVRDDKVVLDFPADEAKSKGRSGTTEGGDPAADFSETTEPGQGT